MLLVWFAPPTLPLGWLTVVRVSAERTSSRLRPRPASDAGSACTRTAGWAPPPTVTWPTPAICEIFWAMMLLAMS